MPKKEQEKKKNWRERQRQRQKKLQRSQEAHEADVQRRPRKWPKGKMIGALCLVLIFFGAYSAWQSTQPSTEPPTINPTNTQPIPYEFTMNTVDGTTFSLASHKGRVIIIHIMAVGCHGQIDTINDNQLTQLKTVCTSYCGSDPITLVTVAVATCPTSDLAQICATYGVTWALGNDYDDGTMDIAQKYASEGDGTIVLIDKTFHVHAYTRATTASALSSEVDELLSA